MPNTAQDRRFAAIKLIMDAYVDDDGKRLVSDRPETREMLADIILDLKRAGRTTRWHDGVTRWSNMVRNTDNELDWAMLQGQIYAGYAAL